MREHAVAGGRGAHGSGLPRRAGLDGDQVVNGSSAPGLRWCAAQTASPRGGSVPGRGRPGSSSRELPGITPGFRRQSPGSSGPAAPDATAHTPTAATSFPRCGSKRRAAPLTASRQTIHRHVHSPITPSFRALHRNRGFAGESASNEMNIRATSRADLHCHSTASQLSKLGVQRALGLPECATPPEEVYELAKRRGMDFVTITDHDTIAGALADRRPPRRLRLRGADGLVQGRAPGGARPLLRHHAPTTTTGCRRTPTTSSRSPSTCTSTRSPARSRTRSTPSRRR